jgi:hypothetical protein
MTKPATSPASVQSATANRPAKTSLLDLLYTAIEDVRAMNARRRARRFKGSPVRVRVQLAPGAEENGLAVMLGDLVRQNLEAKPHKRADFDALEGRVAIVADDADVALTMVFDAGDADGDGPTGDAGGRLTIHSGVVGIPDVTIRGPAEAVIALSNMPLTTPLGLPFPARGDAEGQKTVRELTRAVREGRLHFYGMFLHLPLVTKLTRVMSVNG